MVPLAVAFVTAYAGQGLAQSAFPAPLPGQAGSKNDPAFPPVTGGSFPAGGTAPIVGGGFASGPISPTMQGGGPSEACMKGFMTLRDDAQKRSLLIKAASEHHATPDEACKLIESFSQAEMKMMKYVEANSTKCGIPPYVLEQLKKGHSANTEPMQKKVCTMAQQRPAGPSLSEALGSSAALPEATPKKKGGSAFDTLTGNVLTR